jgi:hypothetical protein
MAELTVRILSPPAESPGLTQTWPLQVEKPGFRAGIRGLVNRAKKAELRESVKQVLMHLLDDPQIQQKIVVLVQKQLRS